MFKLTNALCDHCDQFKDQLILIGTINNISIGKRVQYADAICDDCFKKRLGNKLHSVKSLHGQCLFCCEHVWKRQKRFYVISISGDEIEVCSNCWKKYINII